MYVRFAINKRIIKYKLVSQTVTSVMGFTQITSKLNKTLCERYNSQNTWVKIKNECTEFGIKG